METVKSQEDIAKLEKTELKETLKLLIQQYHLKEAITFYIVRAM